MEKYSKEYFQKKGRKGGNKTKKLYGLSHYHKLSKKGLIGRGIIPQEQAIKEEQDEVIPK